MSALPTWYELRDLVAEKKFEKAEALLVKEPSLRFAVNGLGESVLHYLAVEDDKEGVSWLFAQGFDLNTRNKFGIPVVFEVAQLDHRDLLQWFITNGSDLKCRTNEGKDIKEHVLDFGHVEVAKHLEDLGI
jgi:ankyrin repeat protein